MHGVKGKPLRAIQVRSYGVGKAGVNAGVMVSELLGVHKGVRHACRDCFIAMP